MKVGRHVYSNSLKFWLLHIFVLRSVLHISGFLARIWKKLKKEKNPESLNQTTDHLPEKSKLFYFPVKH